MKVVMFYWVAKLSSFINFKTLTPVLHNFNIITLTSQF